MLRTYSDVEAIQKRFVAGAKLAVIGAGYIGLEVAAVGRQKGLDVTVIEALSRPLARVTSPEMAGFYLDQHTERGVRFVIGGKAAVFKGQDAVRAVGLTDGQEIAADIVIVGAGVTPETSLASSAGLNIGDGIVTDEMCRTSDPNIYAIGDCACRPLKHYGRVARLESVHNAIEGGKIAAAAITGQTPPPLEVPWFWSDQFDLKWTTAGLFNGYDKIVWRGAPSVSGFAAFYYAGPRLLAVEAVNRPGDYLGAKKVMEEGRTIDPAPRSGYVKDYEGNRGCKPLNRPPNRNDMAKITYIEHDGKTHELEIAEGMSVMEGAVKNGVPGIDADCGGACACATCHVYVDDAWIAKTGEPSSMEQSMLDFANDVTDNSRLSCQIKVTKDVDGLIVRIPSSQH